MRPRVATETPRDSRGARGSGTTRATARRPARARPDPSVRSPRPRTRACSRRNSRRRAQSSSPSRPAPNPSLQLDAELGHRRRLGGRRPSILGCPGSPLPLSTFAPGQTNGPSLRRRTRRRDSCRAAWTAPSEFYRPADAQNSAPPTPRSRGAGMLRARAGFGTGPCASRTDPGPAPRTTPGTGRSGHTLWLGGGHCRATRCRPARPVRAAHVQAEAQEVRSPDEAAAGDKTAHTQAI
jgi:hypothetical protein